MPIKSVIIFKHTQSLLIIKIICSIFIISSDSFRGLNYVTFHQVNITFIFSYAVLLFKNKNKN